MDEGVLLDTCALIWIWNDDALKLESRGLIREAADRGSLFASPISAWEVAHLVRKGRMVLTMPVAIWFNLFIARSGIRLTELSPQVLVASTDLPDGGPRDPADQILTATARAFGLILVTRDRDLLAYAEQGHLRAEGC